MRTRVRGWRLLVSFFAGLLLVGAAAPVPAAAGADGYAFEVVGCDAAQFAGRLPAGLAVECALLTVPEDRGLPMVAGNTVVLPVATLKATGSDPVSDPVVMIAGGPGSGGLEYFLGGTFGEPPAAPDYIVELLQDRDVILFDERGTGRAEPSLSCPEELAVMYEIFGAAADPVWEKQVLQADMFTNCLDGLRASGVDLNQYDVTTVARDLKDLRAALGIRKWNAYGHSYGGHVALELLRVQRGGLRSVVLDSPDLPYADQYSPKFFSTSAESGFTAIADEYGIADITGRLTAIRHKFDDTPYETSDPYTSADLVLTGKDAIHILHSGMFLPDLIPALDLLMWNLESYGTGDQFDLGEMLGLAPAGYIPTVFDLYFQFFAPLYAGVFDGMAVATICADQARLMEPADLAALVADVPYGDPRVDLPDYTQLCQQVDIDPIPWGAYRVTRSPVPTMVRQGMLDLFLRPEHSQDLVQRLGPKAQYVQFPTYGHVILDNGGCSTDTLLQFVNNPSTPVDVSCTTD